MKKVIIRAIALIMALSIAEIDQLNAAEETTTTTTQRQYPTRRRARLSTRRQQRRRGGRYSRQAGQRRMITRRKRPQPKTPEAQKEVKAINTELKDQTKNLETQLNQVKNAQTPEEKKVAEENVYKAAQELLASLKSERSYVNDLVYGYESKEIEVARAQFKKLNDMRAQVVKAIEKKEQELAPITDKGYIWNSAKAGHETEYNKLSLEITKLKNALARIDQAISDQNVIAGDEWSKAYKTLLGSGLVIGTAVTGDLILAKGAYTSMAAGKAAAFAKASGAGLVSAKNWILQKGAENWNYAKGLFGAKTATEATSGQPTITSGEVTNSSITPGNTSVNPATTPPAGRYESLAEAVAANATTIPGTPPANLPTVSLTSSITPALVSNAITQIKQEQSQIAAVQSKFGATTAGIVESTLSFAKMILMQMVMSGIVSAGFRTLYSALGKLMSLIANPKATSAQVEEQAKTVQNIAQQTQNEQAQTKQPQKRAK